MLHRVADGVEKRIEDLAQVETRDNGSLLRSHRRGVMPRVAMNVRFFADHLRSLHHPTSRPAATATTSRWDPAGVTAIVTPWNAPLMLATWRIGPALAAGNTVVAKPPEWAPLTASLFADIAHEAGLPPGVFNVVQGLGTEAGAPLVANPGVRRICFTGSVPTSIKIGEAAAPEHDAVSASSWAASQPLLVFEDADLDLAVELAVEQFDNSGQVCLAAVRILVQDACTTVPDEVPRARRPGDAGDPRDESVDIGPWSAGPTSTASTASSSARLPRVPRSVLGGGPNTEPTGTGGFYYRPTVFGRRPHHGDHLPGGLRPGTHAAALRDRGRGVAIANDTSTAWPRPS